MRILVTGSKGFVGKNLVENLKNIRDGKDRTRPGLHVAEIYEYDADSDGALLYDYCGRCDFVFHLAGVNRPRDKAEFMDGNFGFSSRLLDILKVCHNTCPVMFSSSVQASLTGRYAGSAYGESKLACEKLLCDYANASGAKVLIYRFPNLFGKWCRPGYNSAVATFCNAIANGMPYTVDDKDTELELLYIDDLVNEMLDALEGREHYCRRERWEALSASAGGYCHVPMVFYATLGEIVDLLQRFKSMPQSCTVPKLPPGSFAKRLYSTYLSYLPASEISYGMQPHTDLRGSFAEILKTADCGQISVNIVKPGAVRGQHWHNSKCEIFIVVSGHGLIRERRIGIDPETNREYPVLEFEVSGDELRAVQMLPGYTHSIINLSEAENLVTIIWANERFDRSYPDTYYEAVDSGCNG